MENCKEAAIDLGRRKFKYNKEWFQEVSQIQEEELLFVEQQYKLKAMLSFREGEV